MNQTLTLDNAIEAYRSGEKFRALVHALEMEMQQLRYCVFSQCRLGA